MKLDTFPACVRSARRVLFISSHLDDAILSSASLIAYLSSRISLGIVTVFSEGSSGRLTQFARGYVQSCGYADAQSLFKQRKIEEKTVCEALGIRSFLGGFIDASMRVETVSSPWKKTISIVYPEVMHMYPFGNSVFSGRVDPRDSETIALVSKYLRRICRLSEPDVIFCPLGVGGHVDHCIVRDICLSQFKHVVYWVDFPYLMKTAVPKNFISKHRLRAFECPDSRNVRSALIQYYVSQLPVLFPNGRIPKISERYYSSD